MALVAQHIPAVGKESSASFGGGGYSYRGIDAVLKAVGPVLNKYGVVLLLTKAEVLERVERATSKGRANIYTVVRCLFTFTAPDGTSAHHVAIGEASDTGDKSFTKAQSVALRTCLINAFHIPTEDPTLDTEHGEQRDVAPARAQSARSLDNRDILSAFKSRLMNAQTEEQLGPFRTFIADNRDREDIAAFESALEERLTTIAGRSAAASVSTNPSD